MLNVKDLKIVLNGNTIVENVSFRLEKGEVLAIVGPNGAGKSTLLRALLGLIPHQGDVQWESKVTVGYVPQRLSIEHNLPLSVREFMNLKKASEKKVHEVLRSVGISLSLLNQPVGVLSGGEFQRLMIAWALLGNPQVLLFDEPTAGIDIGGEETIYHLLHDLQDAHGLTIILISHDLNVVYQYANHVLCLNKQMICYGEPSEVLDPKGLAQLYGGQPKFFHHEHLEHPHE